MINAKENYYVCDEVHDSIKNRAELEQVTLIPFGAGEIAGFIVCDSCLGTGVEVEDFFNTISPRLKEYRFKKKKKLRAWSEDRQVKVMPFSEMANGWFAGQGPQPGDKIAHCYECQEAPVVFILKFELDPLGGLELEQLKAAGEDVPDPSEMPDYFLLCGACYETIHPDDMMEETDQEIFDEGMQKDLDSKVCVFMDFSTYHERFTLRNIPSSPEIGDIVAACDHMIDDPEFPVHYWYVENAGIEIEVEGKRGRIKKKIIQWLQHCNHCNIEYSGAEAVLANACEGKLHIEWAEGDYEIFPIDAPDSEEDSTNN